MSDALRVKTPDLHERIMNLSGGNQQKVLIGRWLLTKPQILILDEPTRGIDVGAKAEIHRLISKLAGEGVAVIMISSEMPEVLGMSDRIMVMHEGHVTGFLDRAEADSSQDHGTRAPSSQPRGRNVMATQPRQPRPLRRSGRRPAQRAGRRKSASCWSCSASRWSSRSSAGSSSARASCSTRSA